MTVRRRITYEEVLKLPTPELISYCEELLLPYEAGENESPVERTTRVNRSIDHLPDLFTWLTALYHRQDHITEVMVGLYTNRSPEFKAARVKRDTLEDFARACKMRYEGASRLVTILQMDQQHLPNSR